MAKDPDKVLADLNDALTRALGKNLVTFALYGSTARGHHVPGRSDLNTLLIVADAGTAALRPAAGPLAAWVKAGNPAPLIFSEREWRASADVFPLEIEDAREAHRILSGKDPFAGLTTTPDDLRRQLERELRGKLLQLRTQHAAARTNGKALTRLLETSAPTFLVLFRAVLRLKGVKPPLDRSELVRAVADLAGLDRASFDWVVARIAGSGAIALKADDPMADAYVDGIERLTAYVNAI